MGFLSSNSVATAPCQMCYQLVAGMRIIFCNNPLFMKMQSLCRLDELRELQSLSLCPSCFEALERCTELISKIQPSLERREKLYLFGYSCRMCFTTLEIKELKISENNTMQIVIRRFCGNVMVIKMKICWSCEGILMDLNRFYNWMYATNMNMMAIDDRIRRRAPTRRRIKIRGAKRVPFVPNLPTILEAVVPEVPQEERFKVRIVNILLKNNDKKEDSGKTSSNITPLEKTLELLHISQIPPFKNNKK